MTTATFVEKHNIEPILKRNLTEIAGNDYQLMENIRVICRFRPTNNIEKNWAKENNVQNSEPEFVSKQTVKLQRSRKDGKKSSTFTGTLDEVIDPQTSQKTVFQSVGQPMISACVDGFNASIFAYGQTGSGKTYTMIGPENNVKKPAEFGIIPRSVIYLFQKLDEKLTQNGGNVSEYIVSMQMLQIYKNSLLDLLLPKNKKKLVIKTNFSTDSIYVQNLSSLRVYSIEEAFGLLAEAQSNRFVASHKLNANSSRSHMLIMIKIEQRMVDGSVRTSKLNFGDLAGSEDLTKALGKNPNKERRKEAIAINSSLSALTMTISYLAKGKRPSYRDSPLTHILKDSLGGNSKTVMFVACSPHLFSRVLYDSETIRTLRFASTAKKVKNKAKINEHQSTKALLKKIKMLESENMRLKTLLASKAGKMHVFQQSVLKLHGLESLKLTSHSFSAENVSSSPKWPMNSFERNRTRTLVTDDEKINEFPRDQSRNSSLTSDSDIMADLKLNIEQQMNNKLDNEVNETEQYLNTVIEQLDQMTEQHRITIEENIALQKIIDNQEIELDGCSNKIGQLNDEIQEQNKYIGKLERITEKYKKRFSNISVHEELLSRQTTYDSNSISISLSDLHTRLYSRNDNLSNSGQTMLLENLLIQMGEKLEKAEKLIQMQTDNNRKLSESPAFGYDFDGIEDVKRDDDGPPPLYGNSTVVITDDDEREGLIKYKKQTRRHSKIDEGNFATCGCWNGSSNPFL